MVHNFLWGKAHPGRSGGNTLDVVYRTYNSGLVMSMVVLHLLRTEELREARSLSVLPRTRVMPAICLSVSLTSCQYSPTQANRLFPGNQMQAAALDDDYLGSCPHRPVSEGLGAGEFYGLREPKMLSRPRL